MHEYLPRYLHSGGRGWKGFKVRLALLIEVLHQSRYHQDRHRIIPFDVNCRFTEAQRQ